MTEHPTLRVTTMVGPSRGTAFAFTFDGVETRAYAGETIGAALLASGVRSLRRTRQAGSPRGLFCGIGACFDCLVTVNGLPSQRACLTPVRPGDVVESQDVPRLG